MGSMYVYVYARTSDTNIYYMFVSLVRVCVVYVVKEVRHSGGLGQLMGMAHN